MILVGELSLWVALLMAVWSSIVSFAGSVPARPELAESGRRALHVTVLMLFLACAGLLTAILSHDFSVAYVANHATENLPRIYLLGALLAGDGGRLLAGALILSVYSAAATWRSVTLGQAGRSLLTTALSLALAAVLGVLCLAMNPFSKSDWIPADGRGLAPEFQNLASGFHLFLLIAADAAVVLVIAHGAGWLTSRHSVPDATRWLARARAWTVVAWVCGIAAVLLGMWTTYTELGPGAVSSTDQTDANGISAFVCGLLAAIALLVAFVAGSDGATSRRYGRLVLAGGAAAMLIAVVGSMRQREFAFSLAPGASRIVDDPWREGWTLVNQGASEYNRANSEVTAVLLELQRKNRSTGVIASERRQLIDGRGAMKISGCRSPGSAKIMSLPCESCSLRSRRSYGSPVR